ncbi:RicAFT regulatory complex protein RicA family protein [Brevibacillus daliensis]|uniref:RicAFT regulatory complex protein RicA family protein n=1 Tax=Brevibacillus daliensis TaxID=2892995 RepID=UPI001E41025E|nr:YlbF family regulator [Brevibacillus daliensis]
MGETPVYTDNEILEKAREVAKMISLTKEVDFYKRAEAQIKMNDNVQNLIASLKAKQKQLVMFESMNKTDLVVKVQKEFDELQDQLDSIPIVSEFKQSQSDVNDLLQLVTNVITTTVSERIILDTGGTPLSGETGSPKVASAHNDETGCGC